MDHPWNADPIEQLIEEGRILMMIEKMEHWLIGEASDATPALAEITEDEQKKKILTITLDKCSNWSPLHVAAAHGRTDLVNKLLQVNPNFTQLLDSQQLSALHVAAARGHTETVEVLSSTNSMMCLARDQYGRNPLHIAAMNGHDEVLQLFFENENTRHVATLAARVRLDTQETILHLCVKHDQLKSLVLLMKFICDTEFFNAKDVDGNTILHLAVKGRRLQIINFLLNDKRVKVNQADGSGQTAMDVAVKTEPVRGQADYQIHVNMKEYLKAFSALRTKDLVIGDPSELGAKKRDSLLVAAALIATMAFQAGINPPGGETVFVSQHSYLYYAFLWVNMVGFLGSMSTILLLVGTMPSSSRYYLGLRTSLMWLISSAMAITYSFSMYITLPAKFHKPASRAVVIVILVWVAGTSAYLIWCALGWIQVWRKQDRERNEALIRIQLRMDQSSSSLRGSRTLLTT